MKSLDLSTRLTTPSLNSSSFALVVAFGRCKFKLDVASVGLLLQATIGGTAAHFHVSLLAERTFRFFVSSRRVGLFVYNLRSYTCQLCSLTLHLWSNGGPNWRRELQLFNREEALSWKTASKPRRVQPNPTRKSFAEVVKAGPSPPLSGANGVPLGPPPPAALTAQSSGANSVPFGHHHPLLTGANGVPLGDRRHPIFGSRRPVFTRLQLSGWCRPPRHPDSAICRRSLGGQNPASVLPTLPVCRTSQGRLPLTNQVFGLL